MELAKHFAEALKRNFKFKLIYVIIGNIYNVQIVDECWLGILRASHFHCIVIFAVQNVFLGRAWLLSSIMLKNWRFNTQNFDNQLQKKKLSVVCFVII